MEKLEQAVKEELENLGIDVSNATPESKLNEDLGVDSLDAVELVMKLEERFEIKIPDSDSERVETVSDLAKIVGEKIE